MSPAPKPLAIFQVWSQVFAQAQPETATTYSLICSWDLFSLRSHYRIR
jgi:hypothetical protein